MEIAVAHMSLAHTFGNMTAFITEYIKKLFPKNYFNTVNVSSTAAFRYFNIFDNTNKEFIKRRKPMLIVRPRIESNDDAFLAGTLLTSRITDNYIDLDYGNLQPFFEDRDNNTHIKFLMNRVRMNFDCTIIVEQQMEQINQYFYLKNVIRHEHPFYINTFLESNIHRNLIKGVACVAGIDRDDIKSILDYFNKCSLYPLTYKMKNSTGNDEFFRYYPATVDAMFTGLSMDDGSKRGFVADSYAINFTVTTEFNTSGLYYFFTERKDIIEQIEFDIENDNKIIPIFTINNLYNLVEPPAGWELYIAPLFKVSTNRTPDTLDVSHLINDGIKNCIKYYLKQGISMDSLIKVFVFKDNDVLDNETDYSFDYENLILTVNKTNTVSTYRMLMYINLFLINDLIARIHKIDEEK